MYKITCSTSANITDNFTAQFSGEDWKIYPCSAERFVDTAIGNDSDFIVLEITETPSFYRKMLMSLYKSGKKPFIIIFDRAASIQLASTSKPEPMDADFSGALNFIYKSLFHSILQSSSTFSGHLQFVECDDIANKHARFPKEEHLREIVSGVSMSEFEQMKATYNLDLSSSGHHILITKAMPRDYFNDYTDNRRIYKMLDEVLRSRLHALLAEYNGGEVFEVNTTSRCIIINDFKQPSTRKYKEAYTSLLSKIRRLTDDGMTALFISRYVSSPTELNAAYRECVSAKKMRMFYGEQDILPVSLLLQKKESSSIESLEAQLAMVRNFSISSDMDIFEGQINNIFLYTLKNSANINLYYYACSALNVIYDTFCHKYHFSPERRSMSRCFDKYVTMEEMAEHYINIFKNALQRVFESHDEESLRTFRMVSFLQSNFAADITLDDLAAHLGFTRSYTSKYFKKYMGTTFSSYLTGLRIEKAKELLSYDNCKVNQIAAAVGYHNPQFFSRTFSKNVGVSPSEYAAAARGGAARKGLLFSEELNK